MERGEREREGKGMDRGIEEERDGLSIFIMFAPKKERQGEREKWKRGRRDGWEYTRGKCATRGHARIYSHERM